MSGPGFKGKAALISFDDLDKEAPSATAPQEPEPPAEALLRRSGVGAISQSIANHHRVADLEAELARLREAGVIVELDPKLVQASRWKNRDEASYSTKKYEELKAEIEAAGGNVQPIKVRRLEGGAYEIVYGRRRLRACLELGLLVSAIVEDMNDLDQFMEMERENRNREDLSAWEQGVQYKDALDKGLFSSQRQMSVKLGISLTALSTAIRLASLPEFVVAAFPSPLDLQFRWAQPLTEALERGAVAVEREATTIAGSTSKPSAKSVLERLLAAATQETGAANVNGEIREFNVGGKSVASYARDRKGAIAVKIKAGVLTPTAEKKLSEFLERLFG